MVGNQTAYNQIYNVAGSELLIIENYVEHIASALAKNEVGICWILEEDLKREIPEYELPPFFDKISLNTSIEKTRRNFGYNPKETRTWVGETVESYADETTPSFGYEHRKDEVHVADQFHKNILTLEVM